MDFSQVSINDIGAIQSFRDIQDAIGNHLSLDLQDDPLLVCRELDTIQKSVGIPDLRLDTNLMLLIEQKLVEIFLKLGISEFSGMQFPANVRILNSGQDESNGGNYRTTLLHCDSWSGAPSDVLNVFLGLFVSPRCPWLQMFTTLDPDHAAYSYVGAYENAPCKESELLEVEIPRKNGALVFWQTQTPHRTLIEHIPDKSNAWRISIDIRLRRNSPYLDNRELQESIFDASKMNSLGLYWTFPTSEFKTIREKSLFELESAKRYGDEAIRARVRYLEKYYETAK